MRSDGSTPEKERGSGRPLPSRAPSPRPAPPAHSRLLHGASPGSSSRHYCGNNSAHSPGVEATVSRSELVAREGAAGSFRWDPPSHQPPAPRPAGGTEGGRDAVGLTVICRLGWSLPVTGGRWACRVRAALVSELEVGPRRPEVYTGARGVGKTCSPLGSSVDLTALT